MIMSSNPPSLCLCYLVGYGIPALFVVLCVVDTFGAGLQSTTTSAGMP